MPHHGRGEVAADDTLPNLVSTSLSLCNANTTFKGAVEVWYTEGNPLLRAKDAPRGESACVNSLSLLSVCMRSLKPGQCDRKDRTCSQCLRAGATCVYRNALDVLFPAHLTHTKDSMRRSGGRAIALDSRRAAGSSLENQPIPAPSDSLNPDLDEFALSYCYHYHIVHPSSSSNIKLHVQDEMILACMKALGMASYSMIVRSSNLYKVAYGHYLAALRGINAALTSLATAREDATLLAIMVLSCLESVSETWHLSLKGLSMHIQGMVHLIELRGAEQMKTSTGRLLFIQSISFIVTDCVRAGLAVPGCIHVLVSEFLKDRQASDHVLKWQSLVAFLKSADLKSAVIQGAITDPNTIIEKARDNDKMFASPYLYVQELFDYEVHAVRGYPDSDLPAYIYTYNNTLALSAWNGTRNGRIMSNGIILDVIHRSIDSWAAYNKLQPEIENSSEIIRQMQMDILAGVPQYLGLEGCDPWKELDRIMDEPLRTGEHMPGPPMDLYINLDMGPTSLPALRITRGIFLLFNLGMVGRMAESGSVLRTTISKIMRVIGRNHGLGLGFVLAAALDQNRISRSVIDYRKKADAWVVGEKSEEPLTGRRFPEFPERY